MLSFWCPLAQATTPRSYRIAILKVSWGQRNTSRCLHPPPQLSSPPSATESATARTWLASFAKVTIPRDQVKLTFARSPGPGGQNVNKVNTKATVRCALEREWIPKWARDTLMKTPAYIHSSRSLLITSSHYRSQSQNVEDCFAKLHALIHTACLSAIPTPTDPARMARKAQYERAEKRRRRAGKMYKAAVKSGRRGGTGTE